MEKQDINSEIKILNSEEELEDKTELKNKEESGENKDFVHTNVLTDSDPNKDLKSKIITEKKSKNLSQKFILLKDREEPDILDALKLVAPGTVLRIAINQILKARKGGLIAIESDQLEEILEGGFKINCKFTQQKLFELSKMDGAVVLSKDLKKIIYANCVLLPSANFQSNETGIRHKSAERTAKHAQTLVIAISERKHEISLYYKNLKYSLRNVSEILNRTTEKLEILEKQREIYNKLIFNLNLLEISGNVIKSDVVGVIQRIEIIIRISEMIKKDLSELGNQGVLVKIRQKELIKGIEKNKKLIFKDYGLDKIKNYFKQVSSFSLDSLLESSNLLDLFFKDSPEEYLKPKGYRILEKLDLPQEDVLIMIRNFKNLNEILNLSAGAFDKVFRNKSKADSFFNQISSLKEKILLGKI